MFNTPIDDEHIVLKGSEKDREIRSRDRLARKILRIEMKARNPSSRFDSDGCGIYIIATIIGIIIVLSIAIILTT